MSWCSIGVLAMALVATSCGPAGPSDLDASLSESVENQQVDGGIGTAQPTTSAVAATSSSVKAFALPTASADGAAETSSTTAATVATTAPASTTTPTIATSSTTTTEATTTSESTTTSTIGAAGNNFPTQTVVRMGDGANVTMASQLGGGDRPVLLWFSSPF